MNKIALALLSLSAFSAYAMEVSTGLALEQPRNCESFIDYQLQTNPYASFRVAKEIVSMMHNSAGYKLTEPQKEALQYLRTNLNDLLTTTPGLGPLAGYHSERGYRMDTPLDRAHKKLNSMLWLGMNQLKRQDNYDGKMIRRVHQSIEYLNDCFKGDQSCQQAKDRKRKLHALEESRKENKAKNASRKRRKMGTQMPITVYFQHAPKPAE